MGKMPLLDKMIYRIIGDTMGWLGKRAWKRKDVEFFNAMRAALEAGHVEGRLKSKKAS
jgi:hypothetical protein